MTRIPTWQRELRRSRAFVTRVTPAWWQDASAQAHLAYARSLEKPILFLVTEDAPAPLCLPRETLVKVSTPEESAEAAITFLTTLPEATA